MPCIKGKLSLHHGAVGGKKLLVPYCHHLYWTSVLGGFGRTGVLSDVESVDAILFMRILFRLIFIYNYKK